MKYKIKELKDGHFAVCEERIVNKSTRVVCPVFFGSHQDAIDWCADKTSQPVETQIRVVEKPVVNNRFLPARDLFRIVKLEKGVFVVKFFADGKWVESKTFKTHNKANQYIFQNSK